MTPSHTSQLHWLIARAVSSGAQTAVIAPDATLTYRTLLQTAADLAGQWIAQISDTGRDIAPGDRIALLASPGAAYASAVHAVSLLGAILVPLNTRLTSAELRYQLTDCGACAMITDATFQAQALQSRPDPACTVLMLSTTSTTTGTVNLERWIHRTIDPDQVFSVVYTSGTTGQPKGAMLTYGNFLASARAAQALLQNAPADRWLAALPLFHVGGLSILTRAVICGFTAVIHNGFDPVAVNRALEFEGITLFSAVASMLTRMLDVRRDVPFSSKLRALLIGGGPVPPHLLERCLAAGLPIMQTYGMTETTSQVATLSVHDAVRKLGSAGKPLAHVQMSVQDGEICVRGAGVSPGYWQNANANAINFRDGWLHTGDMGYFDADGYLYIQDRRSDLIISGGENVYPAEIEAVISTHPAVAEVGVIGVPDDQWGAVPVAVVVLKPGKPTVKPTIKPTVNQISADELRQFCALSLAKYKIPARIVFADALPRTAAGKLLRRELRSMI